MPNNSMSWGVLLLYLSKSTYFYLLKNDVIYCVNIVIVHMLNVAEQQQKCSCYAPVLLLHF